MRSLLVLTRTLLLMFWRSGFAVIFTLAFPGVLLLVFASLSPEGHTRQIAVIAADGAAATTMLPKDVRSALGTQVQVLPYLEGVRLLMRDEAMILFRVRRGPTEGVVDAFCSTMPLWQCVAAAGHASEHLRQRDRAVPWRVRAEEVKKPESTFALFFLPSVIGFSIMRMCVLAAAYTHAYFRRSEFLKLLLLSPLKPAVYLGGHVGARLTVAAAQTALVLAVARIVFGPVSVSSWPMFASYIALAATGFVAIGIAISCLVESYEGLPIALNIVILPMFFLGGVFSSPSNMPAVLESVSGVLPLTFMTEGLRAILGRSGNPIVAAQDLGYLATWSVCLFAASALIFRWRANRDY